MAMSVQNAAYMDVSALDIVFSAIESDQAEDSGTEICQR